MSAEMRALGLSVISILLTSAVIGNAYYQKKQFYPSVVYITKSNPSMAVSINLVPKSYHEPYLQYVFLCVQKVIYVQSLVGVLMMGKLMRKVFIILSTIWNASNNDNKRRFDFRFSSVHWGQLNLSIWWNDFGMHSLKLVWRSPYLETISIRNSLHYLRCYCFWSHSIG